MTIQQLHNGDPDGSLMGQASSDLIGFFGSTSLVSRQTTFTAVTTQAANSSTTNVGFASTTQANGITTAIASIKATLDNLNLTA
ncbi:MAG: hypothetical protein GY861_14700 [bacterium]|nr:hypothetical protein [bacterium]